MKIRRAAALAAIACGAYAVPAFAADYETTLSAASTKFAWEGAAQIARNSPVYDEDAREAVPCDTPVRPCEEVLFKIDDAGRLTVKVEGVEGTGGTTDVDVFFYKSDAEGTQGEKVASGVASGADTIAVKVTPGFYLAVVDYYHAYNSGYKGTASLAPTAPAVAPAPPAAPAPAPASQEPAQKPAEKPKPKRSKKKSCQAKAKKIKNKKKRAKALKKCKKKKKR